MLPYVWPSSSPGTTSIRTVLSPSGACFRSLLLLHRTARAGTGQGGRVRPGPCTAARPTRTRFTGEGRGCQAAPSPLEAQEGPPGAGQGEGGRGRGLARQPSVRPPVPHARPSLPALPGWRGPGRPVGWAQLWPQQEECGVTFNRHEASAPPGGGVWTRRGGWPGQVAPACPPSGPGIPLWEGQTPPSQVTGRQRARGTVWPRRGGWSGASRRPSTTDEAHGAWEG